MCNYFTNIMNFQNTANDRHQAIIWTNAGILLIGPLWTNFSETLIEIDVFPFKKALKRRLQNDGHFAKTFECAPCFVALVGYCSF